MRKLITLLCIMILVIGSLSGYRLAGKTGTKDYAALPDPTGMFSKDDIEFKEKNEDGTRTILYHNATEEDFENYVALCEKSGMPSNHFDPMTGTFLSTTKDGKWEIDVTYYPNDKYIIALAYPSLETIKEWQSSESTK